MCVCGGEERGGGGGGGMHISLAANLQAKQSHPPFLHRGSELRLPVSEALVEPTLATTTTTTNKQNKTKTKKREGGVSQSVFGVR